MSGQYVVHGRRCAAVGHELEARPGLVLEVNTPDVRWAAIANCAVRGLIRILLEPGNQSFQVFRRQTLSCSEHQRIRRQQSDWLEIHQEVVLGAVNGPAEDM